MPWEDRFLAWISAFVKAHPWLDHQIEARAHALGMHGPALRHVLRAHFDAIVILSAVAAVNMILLIYAIRSRRRRVRRRKRIGARTHPLGQAASTPD